MVQGHSEFFTVVFPLLKPITASVLIIACVYIWNDYQFAIFFLQDKEMHTLTVALSHFLVKISISFSSLGQLHSLRCCQWSRCFYFCKNILSQGFHKALSRLAQYGCKKESRLCLKLHLSVQGVPCLLKYIRRLSVCSRPCRL